MLFHLSYELPPNLTYVPQVKPIEHFLIIQQVYIRYMFL